MTRERETRGLRATSPGVLGLGLMALERIVLPAAPNEESTVFSDSGRDGSGLLNASAVRGFAKILDGEEGPGLLVICWRVLGEATRSSTDGNGWPVFSVRDMFCLLARELAVGSINVEEMVRLRLGMADGLPLS